MGWGSCRCRSVELFSLEILSQPYCEYTIECAEYGLAIILAIYLGAAAILAIGKLFQSFKHTGERSCTDFEIVKEMNT